ADVVAGVLAAMAGAGGLFTLHTLIAAGAPPAAALGTHKLEHTIGLATTVITFARKGRVALKRFGGPAIAAFVGSVGGAFVLTRLDPEFLSGLIPVLLIAMAIYYSLKPSLIDEDQHGRAGPILLLAVARVIGFHDSLLGP